MAKQPIGFRQPEDTAAVFVRVPVSAARKLDRASFEHGRSKREIVAELLHTLEEDLSLGRHSFRSTDLEVLTLEEAAELLRAPVDDVLTLAERGKLPGRKLGGEWRFARAGLLDWLARR